MSSDKSLNNFTEKASKKILDVMLKAEEELRKELLDAISRKLNIGVKDQKLNTIRRIVTELEGINREWVKIYIPESYKFGLELASIDLKQVKFSGTFSDIDIEQINILMSNAYLDFGNNLTGIMNTSEKFLSQTLKEQINERLIVGEIKGDSIQKIKKEMTKVLSDEGITSIKDKGGKNWKLPVYTEMLARTHIIKSANEGITNRCLSSEVYMVEFSRHSGACPICQPYETEIYDLRGIVKPKPPDIPIHPNCKHRLYPRPDLQA